MLKYFFLQLKRLSRVFVIIMSVTLILVLGVSLILTMLTDRAVDSSEKQKFRIAMCGDTDGEYIKLGLNALESLDDSRFSLEIIVMSEEDARRSLLDGDISAFVILPENFIENALAGDFSTITFVTAAGQNNVVAMFKNEIAYLVTDLVVYSQKGTYGTYDALVNNNASDDAYELMNLISLEYTQLVFDRSGVYSYRALGISDGMGLIEYYICSISILFCMIMGIPFSCIYIKKDRSLDRIMLSRGYRERVVLICEYAVHALCMLLLCVMSVMVLKYTGVTSGTLAGIDREYLFDFAIRMIPIVLMISAFNIMIFELFDNIVSGVVSHFFLALSLCYTSGCMYPIFTLPKVMQQVSAVLPTGIARSYSAGAFTQQQCMSKLWMIAAYTLGFLCVAYIVRVYKTRMRER